MNKHERNLVGKKVAARRASKIGWKEKFKDLPKETQLALKTTGNIRLSQRSDKKHFIYDNNQRKEYYGHFSGRNGIHLHLRKKDLQERATVREMEKEINLI